MKLTADPELCTGHARCVAVAPAVYQLDDDGFNRLAHEPARTVPAHLEEQARAGRDACPEQALRVIEE